MVGTLALTVLALVLVFFAAVEVALVAEEPLLPTVATLKQALSQNGSRDAQ
jgi:hypothetical protein